MPIAESSYLTFHTHPPHSEQSTFLGVPPRLLKTSQERWLASAPSMATGLEDALASLPRPQSMLYSVFGVLGGFQKSRLYQLQTVRPAPARLVPGGPSRVQRYSMDERGDRTLARVGSLCAGHGSA